MMSVEVTYIDSKQKKGMVFDLEELYDKKSNTSTVKLSRSTRAVFSKLGSKWGYCMKLFGEDKAVELSEKSSITVEGPDHRYELSFRPKH